MSRATGLPRPRGWAYNSGHVGPAPRRRDRSLAVRRAPGRDGGCAAARWLDAGVPVRGTGSMSLSNARATMDRPESDLPSLGAAVAPIVVPIVLITTASVIDVLRQGAARDAGGWAARGIAALGGPAAFTCIAAVVDFVGNKNVALILGAVLSLVVLARQKRLPFAAVSRLTGPPLETAGVIILITAAGGVFGFMLTQAGVGRGVISVTGLALTLLASRLLPLAAPTSVLTP